MFTDLVDDSSWLGRRNRGWTAVASFALQALAIGGLLLIPLLYPQGLPGLQLLSRAWVALPPPGPPPSGPRVPSANPVSTNVIGSQLMMPREIPRSIANFNGADLPAPELPVGGSWVPVGIGHGGSNGILGSIGIAASPPVMPVAPVSAQPPRVSHMMEGNLIYRVQPEYPALARQARIQGTVVLRALISREGRIQDLRVLSGHPLLVQAAIDAVRQWRYRPYFLNEQPVDVETQITVNFTLAGGS